MKEKYIVFKKVVANELILVEAESSTNAIERVMGGEGTIAKNTLEWYEDCDPKSWDAEPINVTDEELQALRRSARRLPDVFTGSDSPKGDDLC